MSPCLVVSNDTVELLGSLVLGTWLVAVGLATTSGSMVLLVTEVAIFHNRQHWSPPPASSYFGPVHTLSFRRIPTCHSRHSGDTSGRGQLRSCRTLPWLRSWTSTPHWERFQMCRRLYYREGGKYQPYSKTIATTTATSARKDMIQRATRLAKGGKGTYSSP